MPKLNRLLFYFFLIVLSHSSILFSQQTFTVSGRVVDSETNQPLPAASIRIDGTMKGTITTADGTFRFSLTSAEYKFIFSFVGYQADSQKVVLDKDIILRIQLKPVGVQLPEVVTIAEDPAIEIIRKAIANKRKWMDLLRTYEFQAFTRQTLLKDTSIASISESYTTGYWQIGDSLREIVTQKRQTQNIPTAGNFAAVGRITNFNDDEIKLVGYTFVGPTAPDALEYYDYKLLRTFGKSGYEIYDIKVIPKSRIKPLLQGTITISDYSFAVMGVDLKPNEAFTIPFISDFNVNFQQQFSLYEDEFWMPTNIRVNGKAKISFAGFTFPQIGIEQTSVIYDYKINPIIPDSIFKKPRLSTDSSATVYDSTFWKQTEILPLTQIEQAAYESLDSTKTLPVQFRPGGISMTLFADSTSILSYLQFIDARFNRVEGFYFGGKYGIDSLTNSTSVKTSVGYGFSDNIYKINFEGIQYLNQDRKYGLGINIYKKLDNVPDNNFYNSLFVSLTSLIGKNDYRDYFLSSGWRAFVVTNPIKNLKTQLSFISEWHKSVDVNSHYSFVALGNNYRNNPLITDGKLRSLIMNFRYGGEPVFLNLIPVDAIELSVEHSNPKIAKSDFNFTRYFISTSYNFKTFLRSYLFPPTMRVNISAGFTAGNLPPQKLFTADTRLSTYAPLGVLKSGGVKQFTGDRFVLISTEHNFRSIPFLALGIPYLYKKNIELIVHSSTLKIDSGNWYFEGGIGVGKIFDIIQLDFTYRFNNPSKFFITVATSSIF